MSDHDSNKSGGTDGKSTGSDSAWEKPFAATGDVPTDDDGQPTGLDGPGLADPEAALVRADDVQLNDADVGEETLDPQLATDPDTVELVEPTLEPVRISDDTADAAELAFVAAEARRVEAEAEEAGRLAGGLQPPRNDASAGAANATPAAAGTAAVGHTTATGAPDQQPVTTGAETTAAATAKEASHPEPTAPAGAHNHTGGSSSAPANYKPLIWIGLAVILALVLIVVIVSSLLGSARASSSGTPDARGVIAANVTPLEVPAGQVESLLNG